MQYYFKNLTLESHLLFYESNLATSNASSRFSAVPLIRSPFSLDHVCESDFTGVFTPIKSLSKLDVDIKNPKEVVFEGLSLSTYIKLPTPSSKVMFRCNELLVKS